ncbi:MAG: hypothetical protein MH472_13050 [Bacteroidia bacterium]|nr:hypothetical protein [Bacteroidia bacterium]
MEKELIIEHTLNVLKKLPEEKAREISAFADFLLKRFEEEELTKEASYLASQSEAFSFLNEEEEIYSLSDIKKIK